ncbi:LRR receptor-like kinase, partial [Trifolium medium]|nr:LRR receptor-like kinase [Trifolium medium]
VAMLLGDIEVSALTSRPEYLTDWKFDDVSSFITDISMNGLDTSDYNSTSTSIVGGAYIHSPNDPAKPILHETFSDGM